MNIERIPGANLDLVGGDDIDAETEVVSLPVLRTARVFKSQWRPTAEELVALLSGAPIHLSILGEFHPPVMVEVGPTPPGAEKLFMVVR